MSGWRFKSALRARCDDALKVLLQADSYVPDSLKLLYDLGILEDEMGLYVDADRALTRLENLEGAKVSPEVLYASGRVKLDLGQLVPAEEQMREYLKLRPDDASAHYGLGRVYRQGLQFEKAIIEFKQCIALQPKQTEGYYELGDAQLQVGRYAEARAEFEKTLERDPKHGGALTGIGITYFKEKQFEKARETLRKGSDVAPDYQPAHYYLGLTLARLGLADESKKELEIATRLADEDRKRLANRLVLNTPKP